MSTGRDFEVYKINYEEWEIREFRYIGLKIDLPKNGVDDSESIKNPGTLSIGLHIIPILPGVLGDATVIVQIQIKKIPVGKLSKEEYEFQSYGQSEEGKKYWKWYYEIHPETSRYDKGNYSYYRRDVRINDKEILHAHVEVMNAKVPGIEEDHKAVKRILDSIEVIKPIVDSK